MATADITGTRLYEILVIYDPADATKDWDGLVKNLSDRITKLDGTIIKMNQWADNRKLAYEVKGLRRGSYLSGYFRMAPTGVATLERSLRLDEKVIRHLTLSHDRLPPDLQPKSEREEAEELAREERAERGDRDDDRGDRDDRRRRR